MQKRATFVIAFIASSIACELHAHFPTDRTGIYVVPGLKIEQSESNGVKNMLFGAELGAHYGNTLVRYGGLIDSAFDWRNSVGRILIGPSFGFIFLSIDCGYMLEIGKYEVRHGGAFRISLDLMMVSFYAGYGFMYKSDGFIRTGGVIKFPFPLCRYEDAELRCTGPRHF